MTSEKPKRQTYRRLADIPVGEVQRIGRRRAEALGELGIFSVLDLVTHYPRRYIDRTRRADVASLEIGEESVVLGRVEQVRARRSRNGRSVVDLECDDGSARLKVTFFNQPWRVKQLPEGTEALFFGKLDAYRGRRQFTNPVVDLIGNRTGRIVPIYPTSEKAGISGWEFGEWVAEALRRSGVFFDPLPERVRAELGLMARNDALRSIHAPGSFEERDMAQRRLAFDELLRLQLEVVSRRQAIERESRAISHVTDPVAPATDLLRTFLDSLPFPITKAQRRAIEEIKVDLAGPLPMHRLLQGDVGSGKTVVALAALLVAVQGGRQGAFMAPTEVLAEQHYMSVQALLLDLSLPDVSRLSGSRPLRVDLLTSRTPSSERARLREGLRRGDVDLVIGTHALLTDDVEFHSLGVAVVDEQHRFGVQQRAALRAKGRSAVLSATPVATGLADGVASSGAGAGSACGDAGGFADGVVARSAGGGAGGSAGGVDPDLLVMTATPIPRTAAMVVFGDLDVTELDELPAGRARVVTRRAPAPSDEEQVWNHVRSEVSKGHRAYVVCPLVEGSERVVARSATEEKERLERGVLRGLRIGLVHGQMKAADKEGVMSDFRRGEVQVLVATTVIEVGVDVPEATIMVIEDAGRFGIAQLHQLRGRVGRSDRPSWCYLLGEASSPEAQRRLEAILSSTDGFDLAEADLDLRGEGTILGTRQKGRSDLKLASLRRGGRPLVEAARHVAQGLLESDPALSSHPVLADEIRLFVAEEEAEFLAKS